MISTYNYYQSVVKNLKLSTYSDLHNRRRLSNYRASLDPTVFRNRFCSLECLRVAVSFKIVFPVSCDFVEHKAKSFVRYMTSTELKISLNASPAVSEIPCPLFLFFILRFGSSTYMCVHRSTYESRDDSQKTDAGAVEIVSEHFVCFESAPR